MLRLIQDLIRRALADELLFGRLVSGGTVIVDIEDEKIKLDFNKYPEISESVKELLSVAEVN